MALPVTGVAQGTSEPKFLISGNVKGITDNSSVFLIDMTRSGDTLGRAKIIGGQFELSGHLSEPSMYGISFGSREKTLPMFIGNDKISVTGTVEDLASMKVTGSSSNDDFTEFQRTFNPYFTHLTAMDKLARSPGGAGKQDSLRIVYKGLMDSVQMTLDQFIAKKSASYVSPFVLIVLGQLTQDIALQEKRFNALSPEVKTGYYGQYLQTQIDEAKVGALGTEAIDFTQSDTSGRAVTLSSFKGRYVLVDFWASWCGPCRMENPNVVATYKKFKSKNFTVLGVSLDKTKDPWLKAIKADGLDWTQVSDLKFWNNEVAVKYHVQSIPQNFLIDPSGRIIGKNLRGADLQARLCELLGCN